MANFTITLKELIETGFNLFDFDYPMQPEEHKPVFEELFTRHFYFREIGVETPHRFKFQLETELKKLLPYYNKLYMSQGLEQRILDNYDVTETFERETEGQGTQSTKNKSKNLLSDTPVKRINIDTNDFVSQITDSDMDNTVQGNNKDKENWVRKMQGNIGIQTDADSIVKYEASLKNVDMLLLNELDNLFMGVW